MALHDLQLIQEVAGPDFVYRVLSSASVGKVIIINSSNFPELKALETSDITGLVTALGNKIETSLIGAANGVAPLGADSKISTTYLPSAVLGAVSYQGGWDATTNTPTIPAASSSNKGYYYKVTTAGTTNVDGITDWQIGDWIISNGSVWEKVDNTDLVTSVAGKTGAVTLAKGDVGLGNVDNVQQLPMSYLDTDGTMAANSDTKVPSQKAIRTYVAANAGGVAFVSPPASAGASGTAGQISYDNDYFYICVASSTWKRMPLATWA